MNRQERLDFETKNYNPLTDPNYMSLQMLSYFMDQLKSLEHRYLAKEQEISTSTLELPQIEADHVDRGTREEYNFEQFSFQDHEDSVLKEVQAALKRIEEGNYGYCEETGQEIGVKRLQAIPYARYCVEVQSQKEQAANR